jgi:NAD(P)-dependent dehydrogenase (short-subunit alcohol dehydrogenase family)
MAAIAETQTRGKDHIVRITTGLIDYANSRISSVLASLLTGGRDAATKSPAIEYATRGIRVNAVSPGVVNPPIHTGEGPKALGALHPVGHMGEVSGIGDPVLYPESAPFVTGEILHVDGDQSAGH